MPALTTDRPLDLTVYQWRQAHGDLTVFGTWLRVEDGTVGCLAIGWTRHLGKDPTRTGPVAVLRQESAWIFDEHVGDPVLAATEVVRWVRGLGMGEGPMQPMRLLSIIRDHLEDLIRLPPRPEMEQKAVALAHMRDPGTGKIETVEVKDDV